MASRNVNFDFFRILTDNVGQLDRILTAEAVGVNNKQFNSQKVFDYFARIRVIQKKDKQWIVDLERINVLDEAHIGDLQGARQTLATGADQGPLFDTIFLFDTVTGVLILHRNRSGLGLGGMRKYLSILLNDDELDLEVVLDETTYNKFESMTMIQEMEYNIAVPNERVFKDEERSAHGDLDMLQKIRGERMHVKIGAPKNDPLYLKAAKAKAKSLLRMKDEGVKSSTLKVKGMVSGEIDTIDLIKNRMIHGKKFKLTPGKKVTPPLLMDEVAAAYKSKEKTLKRMFVKNLKE